MHIHNIQRSDKLMRYIAIASLLLVAGCGEHDAPPPLTRADIAEVVRAENADLRDGQTAIASRVESLENAAAKRDEAIGTLAQRVAVVVDLVHAATRPPETVALPPKRTVIVTAKEREDFLRLKDAIEAEGLTAIKGTDADLLSTSPCRMELWRIAMDAINTQPLPEDARKAKELFGLSNDDVISYWALGPFVRRELLRAGEEIKSGTMPNDFQIDRYRSFVFLRPFLRRHLDEKYIVEVP